MFLRKGSLWVEVHVVSLDAPPDKVQAALQAIARKTVGELA